MSTDNIYNEYRERISDFVFDEKVASVFDDMIRRSIPGYATIIGMTKVFAERYAQPDSNCYDLGCSVGASTLAIRNGIRCSGCKITAVDNSEPMIERCRKIVGEHKGDTPVEIICSDITDVDVTDASVVVMNFILQFLSPDNRQRMIRKIYDGLLPGGMLLLSEKIKSDDIEKNNFYVEMYHEFKKLMGYSDLEIDQKRRALENVLISDSLNEHRQRLSNAGFEKTDVWFKCFNFVSIAAFK